MTTTYKSITTSIQSNPPHLYRKLQRRTRNEKSAPFSKNDGEPMTLCSPNSVGHYVNDLLYTMSSPPSTYYEATDTPKGTTYFVLVVYNKIVQINSVFASLDIHI
ncbi:hypothetical protein ACTFIW_011100 [Dictyostelium discoideum]